jgi:hypothetical protein
MSDPGAPDRDSDLTEEDRAMVARLLAAGPNERAAVLMGVLRAHLGATLQVPIDEIAPDASLAELGIDSLQALQLRSRLHHWLPDTDLPLGALWDKDLTALARTLAERIDARGASREAPEAAPDPSRARLAADAVLPVERRLWYLDQLLPEVPFHLLRTVIGLRGPLDLARLRAAFAAVVARHPALRARYVADPDGHPTRVPGDVDGTWRLEVRDLGELPVAARSTEADAWIAARSDSRIDLARGPLIDILLARLDDTTHRLLARGHHIQTDGFSLRVMLGELVAEYAEPGSLAALPPAVAPWMAPERREHRAARDAAWTARLTAHPLPPPLFHVGRRGAEGYAGGLAPFRLTRDIASRLDALGRGQGVTMFTTLLAGFFALLRERTQREELWLTTPVANRGWPRAERCVGYVAHNVVIGANLDGASTFEQVLHRTRDAMQEALKDEGFPLESLAYRVHALGQDPTTLVQVCFLFDDYTRASSVRSGGLEWALQPLPVRNANTHRELGLFASPSDEHGLEGYLHYKHEALDDASAAAFARDYVALLSDLAAASTGATSWDVPLIAEPTRSPGWTLGAVAGDRRTAARTEVTAAYVLAGAPEVQPLSALRRLMDPPT